ncbi:orn lys arg major domain containing protein [Stylonychia lemnae]|uniref:Orn lys arg major domain containing protein n=1 Tax=Stylonychia lemnae TaxID=5949 RepID=A0A077ZQ53_STYLE|nr:orn lys arg major domain containing protein [Stylonychia lemnae]|eukprot:CDW72033.1 orn lys arg major domain containing protein [Stylonychia lemnae]
MALAKKKVLVQSNSHLSVYIGLQTAGCTIQFILPEYNSDYGVFLPITANQIQNLLQDSPDIEAIYLTSPNHEGFQCNYQEIRNVMGDSRILVIDEAHGSHYYFSKDLKHKSALNSGDKVVDAVVTSIHKNLGGLTTSPSPFLVLDAECCVREFVENGDEMILRAVRLNKKFRRAIQKFQYVNVLEQQGQDPTKTIFKIEGIKADDLYHLLDKYRINPEKYTEKAVLITIHINISEQDVEDLIEAVKLISIEYGRIEEKRDSQYLIEQEKINQRLTNLFRERKIIMDLRDVMASKFEYVASFKAIGRISAEVKSKSPPGYPILLYGEVIKAEHIEFLEMDEKLKVVI